jgi:hypothetical protein
VAGNIALTAGTTRISGGTISDGGDFIQGASDTLSVDVGSSTGPMVTVAGTVSLSGKLQLHAVSGFTPYPGIVYTLIRNTGDFPTDPQFQGWNEGQIVPFGSLGYQISYQGGASGKDVTLTTVPLNSATTLTSSLNPAHLSELVTLTATVVASPDPSAGVPTGTVAFYDNGVYMGYAYLDNGTATFPTNSLSAGSHAITAVYQGDTDFTPSASAVLSQSILVNPTVTIMTSDQTVLSAGDPLTLYVTVSPGATPLPGPPTGAIYFYNNDNFIGYGFLDENGMLTFIPSSSSLTVGENVLVAVYEGDSVFDVSFSDPLTVTVLA